MPVSVSKSADATMLRCLGNIPAEDNEEMTPLLCQVHSKRLHNGTHVPCSLQSPHSKGIGMITSIWNLPRELFRFGTRTVTPLQNTHTGR